MQQKKYTDEQIKPSSIKVLLVVGFASVTIIMLIIALLGMQSVTMVSQKLTSTISDNNVRLKHGYEMRNAARSRTVILHQMARTDDPFERDELFLYLREQGEKFHKARDYIIDMGVDQKSLELLQKQREYSTAAGPLQYEVIDLLYNDRVDEAIDVLIFKVIPAQNRAINAIDQFLELQQSYSTRLLNQVREDFDRSRNVIISFTLVGVIVGILVSVLVMRYANAILQALYNSKVRENVIRENIVDAIITFNEDGVVESCNRAVYHIFGYRPSEIEGQKVSRMLSVLNGMDNYNDMDSSRLANVVNSARQIRCIHKDGREINLHVGISKVCLNDKNLYIAVLSDISDQVQAEESLRQINENLERRVAERTRELQQANEKLKYLASHDTITGLPNRALLNEHLHHILAGARRLGSKVALLYLDIDGFKKINDDYGHEVGDFLLQALGDKMLAALRQSDLVARVGGDEFIVVVDDVKDTRHLTGIANKLIEIIGEPITIAGHICRVGVSIGISIYPQDGDDIDSLIRCADQAMYSIKSSGKNSHSFYKRASSG
jgi:diguanylate cyclase (GGDEF)-like protein/PAS domain S-box-containing protein